MAEQEKTEGWADVASSLTIVHVQTRMNRSGGCEENTWASCVHQAESGHDVHLVCGASSDVEVYHRRHPLVKVHYVEEMVWNISPAQDLRACRVLKQLFQDIGADVIHTHSSKAGILGRVAAKLAGVPMIVHGVHILPFSNVGLIEKITYLGIEHAAALLTDHFVHVSEGTKGAYRSAAVGQSRPHSVVHSGMEIDKFKGAPWPDDWQQLVCCMDTASKPVTILMMAALEARKRHAEFIREFARQVRREDNVCVLLAGEGKEYEALASLIDELGLVGQVKLLGHRPDPERLVALSDFSVLSSLREGLPRSIIQSMAGSRPAVVSPFPGIEEIVRDGFNGVVATTRDAGEVARIALELVRDPVRLARFREGATESSVDDWSFASMFFQLDAAYLQSLAKPSIASRFRRNLQLGRLDKVRLQGDLV